jgi:hypothetical protein
LGRLLPELRVASDVQDTLGSFQIPNSQGF